MPKITPEMIEAAALAYQKYDENFHWDGLMAALKSLSAALSAQPVVKPLEWVDMGEGPRCITVCGMYAIHPSAGPYGRPKLTLTGMPGNLFGKFDTIDAAKNVAQKDYDTRIRSAIVYEPSGVNAEAALQAIANLPTGRNEDVMEGHEDAYRAVEALFPQPPHIVAEISLTARLASHVQSLVDVIDNVQDVCGAPIADEDMEMVRHIEAEAGSLSALTTPPAPASSEPVGEPASKFGRLFPSKTPEEVDRDPAYRQVQREMKPLRDMILRDAPPAPTGDGWRPIETAPKDGTWVEVWDTDADGHYLPNVTVRQYRKGSGERDPHDFYDHLACRAPSARYTHWRRPAAPTPPKEGGR